MRLAMAMNSAPVTTTDIRRDFRTVLDRIIKGEHVEVSNYARPVAVVVSPEWYAAAARLMDLDRPHVYPEDSDPSRLRRVSK